jgi:hypothetical protein
MLIKLAVFLIGGTVIAPGLMIDVSSRRFTCFAQLARPIPRHRDERLVYPSRLRPWRSPGIRGIRLESSKFGGAWPYSTAAIQRLFVRRSTGCSVRSDRPVLAPREIGHACQASPPVSVLGSPLETT